MKIKYSYFSPHIDYSCEWVLNAPLDEQSIADFIPVISQHFSRAEARRGRGVRAAFNARRHPLVLPCQTLITGNKLENRDCHNPENESGVSSERRCRLSRSRPRYLVTLMPTASAAPSWESTKAAGRVLYLELACLRIIDFLLIGYLRPLHPPFRPSPDVPCDLSYRSLYNSVPPVRTVLAHRL